MNHRPSQGASPKVMYLQDVWNLEPFIANEYSKSAIVEQYISGLDRNIRTCILLNIDEGKPKYSGTSCLTTLWNVPTHVVQHPYRFHVPPVASWQLAMLNLQQASPHRSDANRNRIIFLPPTSCPQNFWCKHHGTNCTQSTED